MNLEGGDHDDWQKVWLITSRLSSSRHSAERSTCMGHANLRSTQGVWVYSNAIIHTRAHTHTQSDKSSRDWCYIVLQASIFRWALSSVDTFHISFIAVLLIYFHVVLLSIGLLCFQVALRCNFAISAFGAALSWWVSMLYLSLQKVAAFPVGLSAVLGWYVSKLQCWCWLVVFSYCRVSVG